jgi:hypothetical protein
MNNIPKIPFHLIALGAGVLILSKMRRRHDVHGKKVLITGGSRGLGFALARQFALNGASVTICGRDEQTLKAALIKLGREKLCRYSFAVIVEEGLPAPCRFRVLWSFLCPTRDSSFGNVEPELQQLAVNARSAPGWILGYHAKNQIPRLLGDSLSSRDSSVAGKPIPIEPETGSMPADDRLRSDDYQNLLPFRPHPSDGNPKEAIKSSKPWPRLPALQNHKLLPKNQILQ